MAQIAIPIVIAGALYLMSNDKKTKKNISVAYRSMIYFFILLCSIGWSFVINYACGYEEKVAWVLAAIPIVYLFFKKIVLTK